MWILLALAAYITFSAATITDKYLLAKPLPDARVYAFYTGILGLAAFIFAPFGFLIPHPGIIFLGIFAGILFIIALFLFFTALKTGEVSRVGIALGGLTPLFTLAFTYIGSGELPARGEFFAFILLFAGSLIVAFDQYERALHNAKIIGLVALSSALFGLYFVFAKFLFGVQPFMSAFLWIKLGGAIFALAFLFSPQVRTIILAHKKVPPKKTGGIFIAKNAAGGVAALLLHLAIATARISEVAIVNALQGVQFALVFLGAVFLSKKFPGVVKEKIDIGVAVAKSVGAGLIVLGIVMLAL